mgnify:CR=1 FL=1
MSIWSKIIELATNDFDIIGRNDSHRISDFPTYAVFDLEVGMEDYKIHDIGAIRHDGAIFHKASKRDFLGFIKNVDFHFNFLKLCDILYVKSGKRVVLNILLLFWSGIFGKSCFNN